jgi:GAF domain-containing protein/C4-dicarboxylate-specific signal transduction histidine kinase/HAMP domain-containing protein
MRSFFVSGLRARLLLLVVLAVGPLVGLVFFNAADQRRMASVQALDNALRLARLIASEQKQIIEGARQLLVSLSQLPPVRGHDSSACNTIFAELLKQYPQYATLGAVDATGNPFCSAIRIKNSFNVADRTWFQRARVSRGFAIGDYVIGRVTGKASLNFGYPVIDGQGELRAVVLAALDLAWLNKFDAKAQLPEGSTLTMIDQNGIILAQHPAPEKWVGKSMQAMPVFRTILTRRNEGTTSGSGVDGIERLYAFTPVRSSPQAGELYISIGIPQKVAFGDADTVFSRNLVAVAMVGVLALLGAWIIADVFIVRRVNVLCDASKRLAAGDLSTRTGLRYSRGELGHLARVFDQMAEALDCRQRETAQAREELKRHDQQNTALHEINLAVTSTLDLHFVLRLLMEKIDVLLPDTDIRIWLRNPESQQLERTACWNLDEKEWKSRTAQDIPPLIKEVILSKTAVVAENVQTDPRTRDLEFYRRQELVSYLGLPLLAKDDVLGVLVFLTRKEHRFSTQEIEFFFTLAGQAAIGIYNARLYEETQRRRREAEEFARVAQSLTETLDSRAVGERVVISVRDLFGAKGATLRLVQPNGSFQRLASVGHVFSQTVVGGAIASGMGITSRALAERRPIWSPDILNDRQIQISDQMREYQRRTGHSAMIAAPLYVREKLIGVLTMSDQTGRIYSDSDVTLLKTFADQAAVALENARLYEQMERHLKHIEALHEIERAITSTLELKAVLNLLLEKIDVFLPFPAVTTIRLFNRATERFENIACRNIDEELWKVQVGRGSGNLSREILKTKQPVVVRDIQRDPQRKAYEFYRKHGLTSYLGVPLIAKDAVLGILGFYTKSAHEFTQQQTDFLLMLAGQAAIAIHNSQLYEEIGLSKIHLEETTQSLGRSLKELGGLYTALSPLAAAASPQEMMGGIIDRLIEATGADAALIRVWDKDVDRYPIISQRNFPEEYLNAVENAPAGSAVDWVVRHGEPIIAPDIAMEPRLKGKRQVQLGLRSCAMLPLKVHDEVRGVMHIASRKMGYFDKKQRSHLSAIARQMGIALENRELFYDLKSSKEELERAHRVKDEFLGYVSHELKAPLNVVMGYATLLQSQTFGEINSDQDKALGHMLVNSMSLMDMINSLLEATKIKAGTAQIELEEVNLIELFEDLKSAYNIPLNKELIMVWDYPCDLPLLKTDGNKLRHTLQNLITNAIKYTDQGEITLSARHQPDSKSIEFKVIDTGIGIAKDSLPFIFDAFHQIGGSETRSCGGVGLGLHIVKKFTELLEGKICVESQFGKGSTFTLTLPLEINASASAALTIEAIQAHSEKPPITGEFN